MAKICQKESCVKDAIKRGKYCIDHCTTRKRTERRHDESKTDEEVLFEIRKTIERQKIEEEQRRMEDERKREMRRIEAIRREEERKINEIRYAEERMLIEEQENEYNEALRRDLEKMNLKKEIERKKIEDEQNFEICMREKIRLNRDRVSDDYYKIKFVFQNLGGLSMISTFSKDDFFESIFNFIDAFFYESNIKFPSDGYELISYPNITVSSLEHSNVKISDKFSHRNIQLTFKEIEKMIL
jgi:hypothetical protein